MDKFKYLTQLRYQAQAITALAAGLTDEEIRQKPEPETWSVLEVLTHLVKEEVGDFRHYLAQVLIKEVEDDPIFNQEQSTRENLLEQDSPEAILEKFKAEREKSFAWLSALSHPDWEATIDFEWGSLSAGDLLVSWVAHDLLHLRQLIELRYFLLSDSSEPYHLDYAGKW